MKIVVIFVRVDLQDIEGGITTKLFSFVLLAHVQPTHFELLKLENDIRFKLRSRK